MEVIHNPLLEPLIYPCSKTPVLKWHSCLPGVTHLR